MKLAVAIDGSENAVRVAHYVIHLTKQLPNAQVEIIYAADHNKSEEDYLLTQNVESLTV